MEESRYLNSKYLKICALILFIGVLVLGTILAGKTASTDTDSSLRDYQISVTQDSLIIYDGDRRVGGKSWDNGSLESIILRDNE